MPDVAAPQPRSLQDEIGSILQLSGAMTAQQQQAYLDTYRQALDIGGSTWVDWLPEGSQMIRTEQDKDRQALIDFMGQHGLEAQQAFLSSNPALARSLGYVDQMAQGAFQNVPEISRTLNQQALDALKLGGKLSPEEERYATQNAREAYSARGMVMGDSASLAEVLNRDTLSRQRLQQAQAFAGSREANAEQFGLQAAQLANATTFGREILNAPTNTLAVSGQINSFLTGTQSATPNFQATGAASLGYASDLFNTNLNMQASMYNSQLNNAAALQAAQIQADAQIASARLQAQAMGASASMQAGAARAAGGQAMTGSLIGAGGAIGGALIAAAPALIAF